MKKNVFLYFLLIFSMGFISAVPGIPHQFYGNIEVNGQPSDDIITAMINSQEYSTIINSGVYGVNPNTFFVEDPESNNNGDEIIFYVGGKEAGRHIFKNNELTKMDFSLTTVCGDGYCLGDETCYTCSQDCGVCTENNEIAIFSPENKTYNTSKIKLDVYSSQDILIWMYSINSETPQVFMPNITLTLYDGSYDLTVIGINQVYQSSSKTVSFSVDIPYDYCGDGTCNSSIGESCSTCSNDCGTCSSGSRRSSSGSSSNTDESVNNTVTDTTNENQEPAESILNPELTNKGNEIINENNPGFFPKITGAVVSFGENMGSFKLLMMFVFLIGILFVLFVIIKKTKTKKNENKISEY